MATSGPTQLLAFLSNDADFRAWAQGTHNMLTACGLVQTADTGQINFTTVTRPAATDTVAGYAIYRFSDALQATQPVFIKLEYGTSNAVDRPALWVSVGTTTSGAGALGGQLTARVMVGAQSSKVAAATLPTYVSGDGSRISVAFNVDFSNGNFGSVIHVERTRNSAGAYTADGLLFAVQGTRSSTNNMGSQPLPFTAIGSSIQSNSPCLPVKDFGNKSAVGSDVAVGAGIYFMGKPFFTLLSAVNNSDIGSATTFTATVLGASHTLLTVTAPNALTGFIYGSSQTGYCVAIPWE